MAQPFVNRVNLLIDSIQRHSPENKIGINSKNNGSFWQRSIGIEAVEVVFVHIFFSSPHSHLVVNVCFCSTLIISKSIGTQVETPSQLLPPKYKAPPLFLMT